MLSDIIANANKFSHTHTITIMKQIIVLMLAVLFEMSSGTAKNKWDCADYYWRDYHGTIPSDAIPAGTDAQGNSLYIGLAYIRGFELLPATIFPKQGVARTTAYASVLNTSQHVKILCSPHKEAFEWISTTSEHLQDYYGRNLIPGGSEVGESLFIGRVFRDDSVIVGKIFKHERSNKGIWFPYGNGPANSLTYEVLSYNCDNVITSPIFDLRMKSDNTVKPN